MPEKRRHRGPHPQDAELFAPTHHAKLRRAVRDLSWLLSRGYASPSAVKLVGDRYQLRQRQRIAIQRAACSNQQRERRARHELQADQLADRAIDIDAFNLITTLEAALAGGVLLLARDGCMRDMASMHGSYRKVAETRPAAELAHRTLNDLKHGPVTWHIDRPVSNSGRIKTLLGELNPDWRLELVPDPDPLLKRSAAVVATADSVILDECEAWFNLARHIIQRHLSDAPVVDFQIG